VAVGHRHAGGFGIEYNHPLSHVLLILLSHHPTKTDDINTPRRSW
jgi:hypothetical protein